MSKNLLFVFQFVLSVVISAQTNITDSVLQKKDRYDIFHPVPSEQMRELNADRPDKTDCPFTVDAGHIQIEMDYVNMTINYPHANRGNLKSTSVEAAPINFKIGLLNNLDFQLVFTTYKWNRFENTSNGSIQQQEGFEGITPRFKVNLVGNDGGFFALALIPFLTIPVSENSSGRKSIESGLGIPYSFDVPNWDVGFQSTIHIVQNDSNSQYHTEFDNSVSVGHVLAGRLSLSGEFFSSFSAENNAQWVGTIDSWFTYKVSENLRIDSGIYIGVTAAADDMHPWIGMTLRY